MSYRDQEKSWNIPGFAYFIGAAACLGGTGYGCDHLSSGTAGGMGCGLVLVAIVLVVRGICYWVDE